MSDQSNVTLDFRRHFFEDIVTRKLGYNPRIEIKPAHLANGLFRAICGGYINNEALHLAVYSKAYPVLDLNHMPPDQQTRMSTKWQSFTPTQHAALQFLDGREEQRAMLNALLGADRTLYKSVKYSSYSLSHASHVTDDNHDREAGLWLYSILRQGELHPALNLLEELLNQPPLDRSDELSILTLPLENLAALPKSRPKPYSAPANVQLNSAGRFQEPVIQTIRLAFDQLAINDQGGSRENGKLDTLRHFVTLGCFAVYFHLANLNGHSTAVPMIFRFDRAGPTLRQASIRSYQQVSRNIDSFMFHEIHATLHRIASSRTYGPWDSDSQIKRHIEETINWYSFQKEKTRERERGKVEEFKRDCWSFYQSYRSETAQSLPLEALARALTDMLGRVLSSTPQDVARGLGTRIGLLSQYAQVKKKTYDPHPDFLEVLVRATIPNDETWTLRELAQHWADAFGILCGVLGNENDLLQSLGIAVDQGEWLSNVDALAELLELSGYARRYADGVVLVTLHS